MNMERSGKFSWVDYAVFGGSLVIALVVGIWSACRGRKNSTVDDYYFGGRKMNIFAVGFSLAATFLSAIGIQGIPSEIYFNGITYALMAVVEICCTFFDMFVFVPFYFKLQLTSVYEYFEMRFSSTLRKCACLLFVVNMMLYIAIVLYAPALALSQGTFGPPLHLVGTIRPSAVSGLEMWETIIVSGLVCALYTSLGGMKAVVWTDTCQMLIMLVGIVVVLMHGVFSSGGVSQIHHRANQTGRLDISFEFDPTRRQSFWSILVGGLFTMMSFAINQATVQRYMSVGSVKAAQKMLAVELPIILIWRTVLVFLGMTMFAYYYGCDPLQGKRIERRDQMVALYVSDVIGYLRGMSGLFTAIVYSATLSTVSSGTNSIVIVLLEDFVKPIHTALTDRTLSERTVMIFSKSFSFVVGIAGIALAYAASVAGRGMSQMIFTIDGACGGPLLGLAFCGMMLPFVNAKGAAVGVVLGISVTMWVSVGSMFYGKVHAPLPLSIEQCVLTSNFTSSISQIPTNPTAATGGNGMSAGLLYIYNISYQYYSLIGFTITVLVASAVSALTGCCGAAQQNLQGDLFLYNAYKTETAAASRNAPITGDYSIVKNLTDVAN